MKKIMLTILLAGTFILLTACASTLDQAKETAQKYNAALEEYNQRAGAYIEASQKTVDGNKELKDAIDEAQADINKGEKPFDEETLTAFSEARTNASNALVADPELLPAFEELTIDEKADDETLKETKKKAEEDIKTMGEVQVPETVPEVPDYSEVLTKLKDTKKAYDDSVQGLKQVTAPTDDFVMDRLKGIKSITEMAPVTEDHDPNGKLGKQGGYIGCIYFRDKQVDWKKEYIDDDNVIDAGTDGGGAIEIFSTPEEAQSRCDYLAGFDSFLSSGSHEVAGTVLIRTSDHLKASQQKELTKKILDALLEVK